MRLLQILGIGRREAAPPVGPSRNTLIQIQVENDSQKLFQMISETFEKNGFENINIEPTQIEDNESWLTISGNAKPSLIDYGDSGRPYFDRCTIAFLTAKSFIDAKSLGIIYYNSVSLFSYDGKFRVDLRLPYKLNINTAD